MNDLINREISWLAFNHAVLQEAADPNVPLIERMRFLGIFSNNLDEFFKVRVASVNRMIELNLDSTKPSIGDPRELLTEIQKTVIRLQNLFHKIYKDILATLEKEGIFVINEKQIPSFYEHFIQELFEEKVLPVLNPIMLCNAKEFPRLKDKSIYLAIKLYKKKEPDIAEYALIEIPHKSISRFVVLPEKDHRKYIILLDDVIRSQLNHIFSQFSYDTQEAYTIKITRDAELDIDNDLSKSFLEKITKGVKGRKKGQPVRFVYDKTIPGDLLQYLKKGMNIAKKDSLIPGERYHNFKDWMDFPRVGPKKLYYPVLKPLRHEALNSDKKILKQIDRQDLLLFYPYYNFSQFINLIREAAIDPKVHSIWISLYRVARFSKVINALISACLNGKSVTVVIELQARFDEESNIYWSKKLEEVGAKVIFGIPGLKVHAKMMLIGRNTSAGKTRYTACISTGNFHEGTSEVYSDVALYTANQKITKEVKSVFSFIEFPYKPHKYNHLMVSPVFMRKQIVSLINQEITNAKAGLKAYIILKINNLVDQKMIRKLYEASQAGVKITLIVRGICSIKPNVPGLSDNITGISIVGRFLEHSRIMIFANNGEELYYLSSADWMIRNFDHRVEISCPVYDEKIQKQLKALIKLYLSDNVKARILNEKQDNQYKKQGSEPVNSQIELYHLLKSDKLVPHGDKLPEIF